MNMRNVNTTRKLFSIIIVLVMMCSSFPSNIADSYALEQALAEESAQTTSTAQTPSEDTASGEGSRSDETAGEAGATEEEEPAQDEAVSEGETEEETVAEKYEIKIEESENGKIVPDKKTAAEGETVKLKILPDEGYALEQIKMNNEVAEPDQYGVYAFVMPGKTVKITAVFAETGIENVDETPAPIGMTAPEETAEEETQETETIETETIEIKEQTVFAIDGSENGAITLSPGSDKVLTVTGLPEGRTADDVVWSSSDREIVYVNGNGILTGAGTGTATITATVDGPDGATYTATVTVGVSLDGEQDDLTLAVQLPEGDDPDKQAHTNDDFTVTLPSDGTYTGSAFVATLGTYDEASFGTATIKYLKDGTQYASAVDAGTYTVVLTVTEGTDYQACTLTYGSFTIEKADNAITLSDTTVKTVRGTAEYTLPTVTAVTYGDVSDVVVPDLVFTSVGENTLTWSLAESTNYKAATATVKVNVTGYALTVEKTGDGTVTLSTEGTYALDGTEITVSCEPADFWFYDQDMIVKSGDTDVPVTGGKFTMPAADTTVYVAFVASEFDVTLETNGGTIASGKDVTSYTYGTGAHLPGADDVTKTGYAFAGWFDNADLTGTAVTEITLTDVGEKHFYAKWTAKMYNVTLNTNGGMLNSGNITEYTYTTGATLPTDTDIVRPGYTFAGWFDNADLSGAEVTSIGMTETGDKSFWARWTPNTYTVTFETNDGTIESGNVTSYTVGTVVPLPTEVTRTGYTFAGWYGTAEMFEGTEVTEIGELDFGDKIFYAKWIARTWTVTLEMNGGTVNSGNVEQYAYDTGAILPTDVTKTGCTFGGWFETAECEGEAVAQISALEMGDRTYYAKWTANVYTIAYETNGGTISVGEVTEYTFGTTTTLPVEVVRDGYTFKGWFTTAALSGSKVSAIAASDSGDKTFYAGWQQITAINNDSGCTAIFRDCGLNPPYSYCIDHISAHAGYVLIKGWLFANNHAQASVAIYTPSGTRYGTLTYRPDVPSVYSLPSDYNTSYVMYLPVAAGTYSGESFVFHGCGGEYLQRLFYIDATVSYPTATFDKQGGIGGSDTAQVNYGTTAGMTATVTIPTRTGYTFQGYYSGKNGTGTKYYDANGNMAGAWDQVGSKIVYAYWTPNVYNVTLETNGGTVMSGNVTEYTYATGATLPTDVTRTGYTFKGWYDNAGLDGDAIETITARDIGDKTYYAKWEENVYSVTLETNGGTVMSGNVTEYTYSVGALLPTDVTRLGYGFMGWYDNAELMGDPVTEITTTDIGDKTYYADWLEDVYQVFYVLNGGNISSGEVTEYIYTIGATLPTDVRRTGYTFKGWFENEDFDGNAITEITTSDVGDKTYYAKWQANTYKVTLETNGGTISGDTVTKYTYGKVTTLPTTLTRTGYTFDGWFATSACAGTSVTEIPANAIGDKTFYARWKADTYTVTFVVNGGTIQSGSFSQYTYGKNTVLPTNVTRKGHIFGGWYQSSACTGTRVTKISNTTMGNKTFYAKWTVNTYAVTLVTNGGTISSGNITQYKYGIGATLPVNVKKTGYTFAGWFPTAACMGIRYTEIATNAMGDKTYYAKWTASDYSVTLVTNGGTILSGDVTSYTYGTAKTLPTNVKRNGYTFAGWYANSACTGTAVTKIIPTDYGNKTYYAAWTANEYTVTLVTNGGTIASGNVTSYTAGNTKTLPTNVKRNGYTFQGWYENSACTGSAVTKIQSTDYGSKTYYAAWTANEYTVTLKPNGGTIASGNVTSYTYGTVTTLPASVTRTGYTFAGWYATSACTGSTVSSITDTELGNKTFYAAWTANEYTVTLVTNGGTIASGNVTSFTYGMNKTLPTAVTKTGYTFGGWYEDSACTGTRVTTINGTQTGNRTYYAAWTANVYTVKFILNGGAISSPTTTSYTYGTGLTLPTTASKTGHVFGGWYENSACTGSAVTAISATDTGNKTYYAKWTKETYTVTLVTSGGTVNTGEVGEYIYGTAKSLPTDVTKTGYTFGGWYATSACTGSRVTSIAATVTGDKTFYAAWTANEYTVTLVTNGGTIASGNVTSYTFGSAKTLPTAVGREGYTFEGWYEDSACEGTRVTIISATETGDKTYYAKWTGNICTVTLVANGGMITGNITEYTVGEGATLPTSVSKTGNTFRGWYESNTFTGSPVTAITETDTENKTYYAKWESVSYTVTFVANGGTIESGNFSQYTYGSAKTLPTNVTKDGYTFQGWYANAACIGMRLTSIPATGVGNRTYYAKWASTAAATVIPGATATTAPGATTTTVPGAAATTSPGATTTVAPAETTTATADGTTVTIPDGTTITTEPDGTVTMTESDGTTITTEPDGTVTTMEPDGTTITTEPDGTVTETKPEVVITVPEVNLEVSREEVEGHITENADGTYTVTGEYANGETYDTPEAAQQAAKLAAEQEHAAEAAREFTSQLNQIGSSDIDTTEIVREHLSGITQNPDGIFSVDGETYATMEEAVSAATQAAYEEILEEKKEELEEEIADLMHECEGSSISAAIDYASLQVDDVQLADVSDMASVYDGALASVCLEKSKQQLADAAAVEMAEISENLTYTSGSLATLQAEEEKLIEAIPQCTTQEEVNALKAEWEAAKAALRVTQTGTEDSGVIVSSANGMSSTASLSVEEKTGAEAESCFAIAAANEETQDYTVLGVYDITLENGNAAEDGEYEVTLPLPTGGKVSDRYKVIHLKDDGSTVTIKATVGEDGKLHFKTDGFSLYIVTNRPNSSVWWGVGGLCAVLMACLVLMLIMTVKKSRRITEQ